LFTVSGGSSCKREFGSVPSPPGMVLNEPWGIHDEDEINRRAELGEGLRSTDVAEAVLFLLTRPSNVTIRDLVMLPRAQDL
jgi:ribitol 2-dehydrogenase